MDELNVRKACFYSTVAVYGSAPEPHHEDAPTNPSSPYGGSKLAGEKVFAAWASKGEGRTCLVIRPTVTFGPRNFANMYSLIRQIYSGKYFQVGPGTNIKSLSYVENIVAATAFLWERPGAKPFEVFNYIDKPDLTSKQIGETIYAGLDRRPSRGFAVPMWLAMLGGLPFDIVIALTGKNLPISTARSRSCSTQTKFEADKLARAGYTPRIPLVDGIDKMVKWYLAEGKNQTAEWHQPPKDVVVVAG
jgi:nucleoside-diphosphate-sugar epimerase